MLGLKGTVECSSPSGGGPSVSCIAATSRRAALYNRLAVRCEGSEGVEQYHVIIAQVLHKVYVLFKGNCECMSNC